MLSKKSSLIKSRRSINYRNVWNPALKALAGSLFVLSFTVSYAQIKVDGVLNANEWALAAKASNLHFGFGYCYYTLQNDTLFFAFDVIADNLDNNSGSNDQYDRIEIYVDANRDYMYDKGDYIFTAISSNKFAGLIRSCGSCKPNSPNNYSYGIYAPGFGASLVFKGYSHRTWEISIPLKILPAGSKLGFGCRITSVYPQFSTEMFMDKGNKAYESLLIIQPSEVKIYPQKNTSVSQQESEDKSQIVISRRILEGGGIERSYADGHKRIDNTGGYTIIWPDGRKSSVMRVNVPRFTPPNLPDANINRWLDSLNSSLLSLIAEWVSNDQASIANMKAGDAGKNIYEIINRKFSVINYLNPVKK